MEEENHIPIDPGEAAAAAERATRAKASAPKNRPGCLARFIKYGAVLLALLAVFVYWNFLRTPQLKISKETTYLTEPLTSDGTRVDYVAALEQVLYPPEMKTDDNGYRLIVRALGDAPDDGPQPALSAQVYEKLGLDPAIELVMSFIEPGEFLQRYSAGQGLGREHAFELETRSYEPWTLEDLPMMEPWLDQNQPVLDLVGEAVRKPVFCYPMVRRSEKATLVETIRLGELQRARLFARMLSIRANYRIGTGDVDGAIDDVITCERLGRHLESQGTVLTRLVGIAIEGIAASLGVAAVRESQPTREQLQRFVDELDSLPPRPDMDQMWWTERYFTLDSLQAMALGEESLGGFAAAWNLMREYDRDIATYVSVDWNIVMRRVNVQYDDLGKACELRPRTSPTLGDLFLSVRSRRVADSLAAWCMPAYHGAQEAIRRSICMSNLRRIALAMLMYERQHGTLPPAYTVDAAGRPLHSWRVLLLPHLGEEELYGKIHLDEPWDSQHNRQFHDADMTVYQCRSASLQPARTTYSVVVGEKTAFQAGKGKSLDDFGMNLVLVVEREQSGGREGQAPSVCWMDPTSELVESIAVEGINRREDNVVGIGSRHSGGVYVGLRDGGVLFVTESIDLPSFRSLLDGTAESRPR